MIKHKTRACLICSLIFASLSIDPLNAQPKLRPFTERDFIESRKPAQWSYDNAAWSDEDAVSFSPDKSSFVFATRRGIIESNENEFELYAWRTADIEDGKLRPRRLFSARSTSQLGSLQTLIWSDDSKYVYFLAQVGQQTSKVFRVSVEDGHSEQVTSVPNNVVDFTIDNAGETLALVVEKPPEELAAPSDIGGLILQDTDNLVDLIRGYRQSYRLDGRSDRNSQFELFVQRSGRLDRVDTLSQLPVYPSGMDGRRVFLSPDGKFLIATTQPMREALPDAWLSSGDPAISIVGTLADYRAVGRAPWPLASFTYEIANLSTGKVRPAFQGLTSFDFLSAQPSVIWSKDSKFAFLNFALSSAGADQMTDTLPATASVLRLNVDRGTTEKVASQCFQVINVDDDGTPVCIGERQAFAAQIAREYQQGAITLPPSRVGQDSDDRHIAFRLMPTNAATGPEVGGTRPAGSVFPVVSLDEGPNRPPRLVYRAGLAGDKHVLFDLNPDFTNLRLAKVTEIEWEWRPGQKMSAGLYLPPGYKAGERYPLVIQTHGWYNKRFWPAGYSTSGYAAQALAARGIVVVQIGEQGREPISSDGSVQREFDGALLIYRSVIAELDRRGIIDPKRVGIIGFSQSGSYVGYSLVADPGLFAAAATAEGVNGDYYAFMSRAYGGGDPRSQFGGPPIEPNLKNWTRCSIEFQLGRVRTPLRMVILDPSSILTEWGYYEGLKLRGKPVEAVLLRGADHIMKRPLDILVASAGNVDWFDYWLNGAEGRRRLAAQSPALLTRWDLLKKQQGQLDSSGDHGQWVGTTCR